MDLPLKMEEKIKMKITTYIYMMNLKRTMSKKYEKTIKINVFHMK